MEKTEFDYFMELQQEMHGGSGLEIGVKKDGFECGSFYTSQGIFIGTTSTKHIILILDRRGQFPISPKTTIEIRNSLLAEIPIDTIRIFPVLRSYPGEYIGYGAGELIPDKVMAIMLISGSVAKVTVDAWKNNETSTN